MNMQPERFANARLLPAFVALLFVISPAASAQAQEPPPDSAVADSARGVPLSRMPTEAERWRFLKNDVLSARLLVGSFGAGTVAHLRDDPDSWGGDAWGYGARVASNAGGTLVYFGAEHGLSAVLGADVRYAPLGRGSTGRRIRHAFWETVTVRTGSYGRLPNAPVAGGVFAADLAQNRWETGDFSFGDAGLGVAIALGFEFVENLFEEF